jgi:glutathione S-transferase
MAGRRHLCGADLTLADIGNGILAHRWQNYPIERPQLPNIKAWYERLSQQPGFRAHIMGPIA